MSRCADRRKHIHNYVIKCTNVSTQVSEFCYKKPFITVLWYYFGHNIRIHQMTTGHIHVIPKLCCTVDIGPNYWKYSINGKIVFPFEYSTDTSTWKGPFNYKEELLLRKSFCSQGRPAIRSLAANKEFTSPSMDTYICCSTYLCFKNLLRIIVTLTEPRNLYVSSFSSSDMPRCRLLSESKQKYIVNLVLYRCSHKPVNLLNRCVLG